MKLKKMLFTVAAGAAFSLSAFAITADYSKVVPLPATIISDATQKGFQLNPNTVIIVNSNCDKMQKNAELLAGYIKKLTGYKLKVVSKGVAKNAILLNDKLDSKNKEAYTLTVSENAIQINGASASGNFYGIQTLRKSLDADKKDGKYIFPAVSIADAPRFAYRGTHLDCSRHFFTADSVKQFIDILALHNINNLHWHLTDDQGWRIEVKKYPELVKKGSMRKCTVLGLNTQEYNNTPHGGYYTQDQLRDIVKYAADRHINIVPEVDMPGHMLGVLAGYPELGCTGGPYELWCRWGVSEDVLCAGNEKVYKVMNDIMDEVCDIFPSEYIHIGGDECPKNRWKECPKCQAKIKELGLQPKGKISAEEQLQSYFMSQITNHLATKGRKTIGWDEIMEGGLAPGAIVMSWRGENGGREAAKMGHDAIMTPSSYLYLDFPQVADNTNEPLCATWGKPNTLQKIYGYEPVPSTFTKDEAKHIIGLQGNLWTEYMPNMRHVQYMAIPRLAGLCEVQWTAGDKDYEKFQQRMKQLASHYRLNGFNYAPHGIPTK